MRLKDKVVCYYGGRSNGIGAVAASSLANRVQSCDVDFDVQAGKKKVKELQGAGVEALFYQVDVASHADVKDVAKRVLTHFEKVDVLINNAGITKDSMLLKLDAADFQKVIDINLTGVFNCTQAFIPSMLAQGKGKVINTHDCGCWR